MTADATPPTELSTRPDDPPPFADDPACIATAAIEQLRARRFSYGDDRRDIEASLQADTTYSDNYKAQLLEGFVETAEAESMALATRAWRDTLAAEERLADEVAYEAQRADTGLDHAAISTFMADYSARLSMPPPATGIDTRTDTLRYIASMADEVEASRSPERMRAFRVAAAPVVRSLVRGYGIGTPDQLARDLDRRISTMAARERGKVAEAEGRLDGLRRRKSELRHEILNLERTVAGAKPNVFAPVTPWAAKVLGETMETYGGGVHFKGKS